jgi:hypothetical protein
MNPRTRKAALYAIGVIAILASINALAHSYAGLYDWATHHRLSGWQAMSWPAEIDVFLAVGELALYVAYLDGWPPRQRIWPWATALTGLAVSIAGNIGHIQAHPGHPVIPADRLTAATSPLAAEPAIAEPVTAHLAPSAEPPTGAGSADLHSADHGPADVMRDARTIYSNALASGERLSQRALARQLRGLGHQFPNDQLHQIATRIGLAHDQTA